MNTKNAQNLVILSSIIFLCSAGCKRTRSELTGLPPQNGAIGNNEESNRVTESNSDRGGLGVPRNSDPTAYNLPTDGEGVRSFDIRSNAENYSEDRDRFVAETVYFDYDSATVRSSEKPKLEIVASYLKSEPNALLRLEGHCDERGTDEYNRALGERRVLSIRENLSALGVPSDRASTVSYGEDKPAMVGSDELSWARNRRGEFVVLTPKN